MSDQPAIAVTLGPCDDMRAEVFVRVQPAEGGHGPRLVGTLVGPECRQATTLPATARLADLGPPPGDAAARPAPLVARAILTEPAFWTPDLPNLYRLEARVEHGDAVATRFSFRIGLRRLGTRGRSFRLDGRRWVPRGVRIEPAAFDTRVLRSEAATAVVTNPDDTLCARADAEGVAVIAAVDEAASVDAAAERIAGWAIHPAVVMALLPVGTSAFQAAAVAAAIRGSKGTVQLGWTVDGEGPPPSVPAGIDWLAVTVGRDGLPHAAWRDAAPPLPLVACGGSGGRAGCDALQARLAAWLLAGAERPPWDWAGYVVW